MEAGVDDPAHSKNRAQEKNAMSQRMMSLVAIGAMVVLAMPAWAQTAGTATSTQSIGVGDSAQTSQGNSDSLTHALERNDRGRRRLAAHEGPRCRSEASRRNGHGP